jgi:hypothetical protein
MLNFALSFLTIIFIDVMNCTYYVEAIIKILHLLCSKGCF